MTLLLDTTVLIDILRGRGDRRSLLASMVERGDHLTTAAINIAEVFAGLRPEEEAGAEIFLGTLTVHPLTPEIARRAGKLKYTLARSGRTVALPDMIVAATALEHRLALLTDNGKDFLIPDLTLFPLG